MKGLYALARPLRPVPAAVTVPSYPFQPGKFGASALRRHSSNEPTLCPIGESVERTHIPAKCGPSHQFVMNPVVMVPAIVATASGTEGSPWGPLIKSNHEPL